MHALFEGRPNGRCWPTLAPHGTRCAARLRSFNDDVACRIDHEYSLTQLAQTLSDPERTVAKQSVQKEVDRLVDAGVLRQRHLGRNRLVRANPDHLALAALTQLAPMPGR